MIWKAAAMPRNFGIVSALYKLARTARDIEVVTSFDAKKMARRYMNKQMGRHVLRRGYFGSPGGIFRKIL